MATVRFSFDVATAPHVVRGALIDFTDRRPAIWPDLDPDAYRVEQLGPTSALVREGQRSPRLWALEEYDWSTPDVVTWTARESNFCAPGSFMSARIEPGEEGGTRVHVTWSRTGVGAKGKAIVALVRLTGGRPLATSLRTALSALANDARAA